MIKHVKQPPKSKLCGHACIAMLLGISLKTAVDLIGHEKGTRTKVLTRTMRKAGAICNTRLSPFRSKGIQDDFRGLAKVKRGSGNWHWIVIWDRIVYDPNRPNPVPLSELVLEPGRKITSGLRVNFNER